MLDNKFHEKGRTIIYLAKGVTGYGGARSRLPDRKKRRAMPLADIGARAADAMELMSWPTVPPH
jgi:hypothetical protein